MAEVHLEKVCKIYDKTVNAVQDFTMTIADREFVVLVGPSGCGKSTTLRMIAGLEDISAGELYIDGQLMNHVPAKERGVSMVFQNYALFPYMTVFDNIAFGLNLRKEPKEKIREKVYEAAELLDITDLLQRKPKALSGGQRQRVAIGRSIVRQPKLFLMDEPLSNLDAKLRNQMRAELIKLRKRMNSTFVYVTHDQTEAMTLGDRIVVMHDGFIKQIGSPQQVFNHPENRFVAGFIGTPQMNFFRVKLRREEQEWRIYLGSGFLPLPDQLFSRFPEAFSGEVELILGIRPEDILFSESGGQCFEAELEFSELLGSTVNLHFLLDAQKAVVCADAENFEAGLASRKRIGLKFPLEALHFFHPESGENLLR
ncbi:MAG: ABC transporter ATP-binding protein [Bacillota bacterium]|nr:ABC transporter ATP-binding protein [Bacillota bacterium]